MKRIAFYIYYFLLLGSCTIAQRQDTLVNGWKLSQEKYDADRIRSLKEKINSNEYKQINSIVVIKNGSLLIEEYFNGAARNQTHDPRSVGKTFTSAILGIALNDGYIKSINQQLKDFYNLHEFQNYSLKKDTVSLKNLVTMSSAFDGNDNDTNSPGNEENMYPQANWVQWALNLPMANDRTPGERSVYFTAGVVILGDIINKSVPGGLEKYAQDKLFGPLGINNYQWEYTPQHVPSTAGAIRLTPLDFARFGQLYLSGGKWKNQQLLPEKWVTASLKRYYETTFDNNGYGYLWWNKKYKIGNKEYETFYCSGNGGNKIFLFKELNTVIVIAASAYNQRYAHPQVDDMMIKYILPAILQLN
jgi:CubicO group peptidase (beta-lactamase class C family)